MDYRGDIGVILINTSDKGFVINPGDRIGQIVMSKFEKIEWQEESKLNETVRGEDGFGSTDVGEFSKHREVTEGKRHKDKNKE